MNSRSLSLTLVISLAAGVMGAVVVAELLQDQVALAPAAGLRYGIDATAVVAAGGLYWIATGDSIGRRRSAALFGFIGAVVVGFTLAWIILDGAVFPSVVVAGCAGLFVAVLSWVFAAR
jgi:hypothetical protein